MLIFLQGPNAFLEPIHTHEVEGGPSWGNSKGCVQRSKARTYLLRGQECAHEDLLMFPVPTHLLHGLLPLLFHTASTPCAPGGAQPSLFLPAACALHRTVQPTWFTVLCWWVCSSSYRCKDDSNTLMSHKTGNFSAVSFLYLCKIDTSAACLSVL